MQGRYYLPQYHRFASPDHGGDQHPEDPQTWNLYSYVRNNPTMLTDPTGLGAVPWYLGGSSFIVDRALQMLHGLTVSANPGYQVTAQATDVVSSAINAAGNKNWAMLSNMGKAADNGAGAGQLLLSHSMEVPTSVMMGEVGGNLLGSAGNFFSSGGSTAAADRTLFHYTSSEGAAGIRASGAINASDPETLWSVNAQGLHDAGMFNPVTGMGNRSISPNVFFTDVSPSLMTPDFARSIGIRSTSEVFSFQQSTLTNGGIPVFQNPTNASVFNAVTTQVPIN